MFEEAKRRNADRSDQASFGLYDGLTIPFPERVFDRAFTVNTIYFWENTLGLLNEIYRVLQAAGVVTIAFSGKEFMQTLPFTNYGFELFDHQAITDLVNQSKFETVEIADVVDNVTSKSGEKVERHYSIATVSK